MINHVTTHHTSTGDRASERVNVVVLSKSAPRPERACVNPGARGAGVARFESRARVARGSGALDHPHAATASSLGCGAHLSAAAARASPPHGRGPELFAPATCGEVGRSALSICSRHGTEWRAQERRASTLAGLKFDRSLACQAGEIIEQDKGHLISSALLSARARVDDRVRSNPSTTAHRQCERRS